MAAVNSIVLVAQDGQVVCERCELADGFFNRGRGLLGRERLERGHGMLIKPTWSVHTAFMRFAIDVLFLDREMTVVGVKRRLRLWRSPLDAGLIRPSSSRRAKASASRSRSATGSPGERSGRRRTAAVAWARGRPLGSLFAAAVAATVLVATAPVSTA